MKVLDNLKARGQAAYATADRRLGGAPTLLASAYRSFVEDRAGESAASLAYYGLFALFPFLLVLIFVGTLFLGSKRAETELVGMVTQMLPGSQLVVQQNLHDVMERRGPATIIGIIGLLWSASGFFVSLTTSLRRAWPAVGAFNFLRQRLSGAGAVFAVGLMLVLWSVANVVLNAIPRFLNVVPGAAIFWNVFARILPVFLVYPMLVALYRWTAPPGHYWRAVMVGAGLAAVVLQALILGFGWFLGSGLVNYEVVYGSLGGVIALLVFAYLMSFIILFGAYVAAAMQERKQKAASPPDPLSYEERGS